MKRRAFLKGLAGCLAAGVAPMAFGIGPAGLSVPRRLAPIVTHYPAQERFIVTSIERSMAGKTTMQIAALLNPAVRSLHLTGLSADLNVGDIISIEGASFSPFGEECDIMRPMDWRAEAER